jgi:hypothetical protein
MVMTTDDQYGTSEDAHQANRRDFQAYLINAVVVRQWQGQDDGPEGKIVLLTDVPVELNHDTSILLVEIGREFTPDVCGAKIARLI